MTMVSDRETAITTVANSGWSKRSTRLSQSNWLALALALLAFPSVSLTPQAGLDSSWQTGLAVAATQGLRHGSQIDFTYGPLGFLAAPTDITRVQPIGSMLFILAVGFTFFSILPRYLQRWLTGAEVIGVEIALALAWGSVAFVAEEAAVATSLAVIWLLPQPDRDRPPPDAVFLVAGLVGEVSPPSTG